MSKSIKQLSPIVVTPEGVAEESLLERFMNNIDIDTAHKSLVKTGQKIIDAGTPSDVVKDKLDEISDYATKDYLMETFGGAGLTEAEIALNKKLKNTGLQVDLPNKITDIDKIREGDYSDFTRGGFKYNLGKGWQVKGSVKINASGEPTLKAGVGFKKDFNMPDKSMVIRAFENIFGKKEE